MAKFILLLKSGDFQGYSPEEMQQILERYLGWADQLRKQGRYHGGEELKESGRILESRNNQIVDGPYTETKEAVGGYFLIEAADLEEAVRISRECPHLSYNGIVELREINPH